MLHPVSQIATEPEHDSFADLIASYERMGDLGIQPSFAWDHGMTMSLHHRDPEGNHVDLRSKGFSDRVRSSDGMRTSPNFARSPIGTFLDPERVSQARKAGQRFTTFLPDLLIPSIGLPA